MYEFRKLTLEHECSISHKISMICAGDKWQTQSSLSSSDHPIQVSRFLIEMKTSQVITCHERGFRRGKIEKMHGNHERVRGETKPRSILVWPSPIGIVSQIGILLISRSTHCKCRVRQPNRQRPENSVHWSPSCKVRDEHQ